MKRDGAGSGSGSGAEGRAIAAGELDLRGELESVLSRAGLDAGSVTVFADAALLAGAVASGRAVTEVGTGFVPSSVPATVEGITRQSDEGGGAVEGSVDAYCATAGRAQVAVEAVNQVICRLEGVRVVAVGEGVVAMGRAELARVGAADPGELAEGVRERWRWRSKSRVRQDLAPATGWTKAGTAALVAVASAPVAFRAPVTTALARGTVTWALVGGLWRACDRARLSAADAAHVAMVMLADDPATCVPERLEADGSITTAPWGQGAFWVALDREVSKLIASPDPEDAASVQAAQAAKAARQAAFAARSMWIRVNEDGTAQVGFTGSVLKVLALGDRLDKAARAARGAGDARTVTQLANDIGIALLGHAVIGAHELPDLDIFKTAQPTPEDLAAAGWTPQVIAALSSLPPAVLQVIVPLLALHDPAQAHTLPGVHRTSPTQDPNSTPAHGETGNDAGNDAGRGASEGTDDDAEAGRAVEDPAEVDPELGHTGTAGCPACLPSARAARNHDIDAASRRARQEDSAQGRCPGADSGQDQDQDHDCDHDRDRDESGCFALLDPAASVVDEICLLTDGYRSVLEQAEVHPGEVFADDAVDVIIPVEAADDWLQRGTQLFHSVFNPRRLGRSGWQEKLVHQGPQAAD